MLWFLVVFVWGLLDAARLLDGSTVRPLCNPGSWHAQRVKPVEGWTAPRYAATTMRSTTASPKKGQPGLRDSDGQRKETEKRKGASKHCTSQQHQQQETPIHRCEGSTPMPHATCFRCAMMSRCGCAASYSTFLAANSFGRSPKLATKADGGICLPPFPFAPPLSTATKLAQAIPPPDALETTPTQAARSSQVRSSRPRPCRPALCVRIGIQATTSLTPSSSLSLFSS